MEKKKDIHERLKEYSERIKEKTQNAKESLGDQYEKAKAEMKNLADKFRINEEK